MSAHNQPKGGGGGWLPYESDGDARRLPWGCKLQFLVSLKIKNKPILFNEGDTQQSGTDKPVALGFWMFRTESQYFYSYRYCLG